MTRPAATYRVSVAGGLRVAAGPLALVAANVATLLARGYRVWVRDPDGRAVAIHLDHDQHHLTYHPGPAQPPLEPTGRGLTRPPPRCPMRIRFRTDDRCCHCGTKWSSRWFSPQRGPLAGVWLCAGCNCACGRRGVDHGA